MKYQQWINEERKNHPNAYISRESVWKACLRHGVAEQQFLIQMLCDIKGLLISKTPSREECQEIVGAINNVLEINQKDTKCNSKV
jgi:hypothetical protein